MVLCWLWDAELPTATMDVSQIFLIGCHFSSALPDWWRRRKKWPSRSWPYPAQKLCAVSGLSAANSIPHEVSLTSIRTMLQLHQNETCVCVCVCKDPREKRCTVVHL